MLDWLTRLFRPAAETEERTIGTVFAPFEFYEGGQSSGVNVHEHAALGISPLYRALAVIAGKAASLDRDVIQINPDGTKTKKPNHPVYQCLNVASCDLYPANSLIKFLVWNMILHGNGLAWIKSRFPLKMYGLEPQHTILRFVDGKWVYQTNVYITPDGDVVSSAIHTSSLVVAGAKAETVYIPMSEVFHLRNSLGNQLVGYSLLDILKDAIGEQIALQKYSSNAWKNGCQIKTVIETGQGFNANDPVKMRDFRRNIDDKHQGVGNANRVMLLQNGCKAYNLGVNNEQIQWATAREMLSPMVVSQLTGVPQHLLGVVSGTSQYKNEEEKTASFLSFTMGDVFDSFEAEARMKLFSEKEKGNTCLQFNRQQLIQHDIETLDKINQAKLLSGRITINELLAQSNQEGIGEDGDKRFLPTNVAPLDKIINPPKPPAPVMPGTKPGEDKPKEDDNRLAQVQEQITARIIKRLKKSVEARCKRPDFKSWDLVEYHRDVLVEHLSPLTLDGDVITDGLLADLQDEIRAVLPEQLPTLWTKYEVRLLNELRN